MRNIPAIKGTIVATPDKVFAISILIILVSYAVFGHALWTSSDLNLQAGPPVGGDFVAFWASAKAVFDGLAADIYQIDVYEAYLLDNAMPRERFGISWQYPPTYYFFIMPLAALPFVPGYFLWTGGTMLLFLLVLRHLFKLKIFGMLLVFATPVVFNAVITGQNGFLTASLLFLAVALPDRRPLIAGVAAGLLTIKPQLGVLLPIAFMMAGCWRAFAAAVVTVVLLIGASFAVFGMETWIAFIHGIIGAGNGVQTSQFPIHKMPTVFAAFHKLGLPGNIAMIMQAFSALATVALVGFIWRRVREWDLRAAILCSAVFLCSPYAYYYEMTILVLPVIVLVRRAQAVGWMRYEELLIATLWLIPLFLPGMSQYAGAQLGIATVLLTLFLCLRRTAEVTGFTVPWRSATPLKA